MKKFKLILFEAQVNRLQEVIAQINVYNDRDQLLDKLQHSVLLAFHRKLVRRTEFSRAKHTLNLEMHEAIALKIFWQELNCRSNPYDLGIQQYILTTVNI